MAVAMIGPKFYAWDRNGKPLAFGKLYTYQARTNVPKPTYQSEDQIIENTNPVILNGEGYANVYLSGAYKMVLKDDKDNEIWSSDPVTSASNEEWVNCVSASYLGVDTFSIAGNFVDKYDKGRAVRLSNSVSYFYSTIKTASYAGGETVVVVSDPIVPVDLASSCVSIVGLKSTNNDDRYSVYFDTVNDMVSNTIGVNFKDGMKIKANGFNQSFDCKEIKYDVVVSTKYTVDAEGILYFRLDNGLYAELSDRSYASTNQAGIFGDETEYQTTHTYKNTTYQVTKFTKEKSVSSSLEVLINNVTTTEIDDGNYYLGNLVRINNSHKRINSNSKYTNNLIHNAIVVADGVSDVKFCSVGFTGEIIDPPVPLPITSNPGLQLDPGYVWFQDYALLGYGEAAVQAEANTSENIGSIEFSNCRLIGRANGYAMDQSTVNRLRNVFQYNEVTNIWYHGVGTRTCESSLVENNVFTKTQVGLAYDSSTGSKNSQFLNNVGKELSGFFKAESLAGFANETFTATGNNMSSASAGNQLSQYICRLTGTYCNVYNNDFNWFDDKSNVSAGLVSLSAGQNNFKNNRILISASVAPVAVFTALPYHEEGFTFFNVDVDDNTIESNVILPVILNIRNTGAVSTSDHMKFTDNKIHGSFLVGVTSELTYPLTIGVLSVTNNKTTGGDFLKILSGALTTTDIEVNNNNHKFDRSGTLVNLQHGEISNDASVIGNVAGHKFGFSGSDVDPTSFVECRVANFGTDLLLQKNVIEVSNTLAIITNELPLRVSITNNDWTLTGTSSNSNKLYYPSVTQYLSAGNTLLNRSGTPVVETVGTFNSERKAFVPEFTGSTYTITQI